MASQEGGVVSFNKGTWFPEQREVVAGSIRSASKAIYGNIVTWMSQELSKWSVSGL